MDTFSFKRMNRIGSVCLLALFLLSVSVFGNVKDRYLYEASFETAPDSVYSVFELSEDIFKSLNKTFSNINVVDEKGDESLFMIREKGQLHTLFGVAEPLVPTSTLYSVYDVFMTESKKDQLGILSFSTNKTPIDRINLTFLDKNEILGYKVEVQETESSEWKVVYQSILDGPPMDKLVIRLDHTLRFHNYRVLFTNNTSLPIEVTQVRAVGPRYVLIAPSSLSKPVVVYGGTPHFFPKYEDPKNVSGSTFSFVQLDKQRVNPTYAPGTTEFIPVQKNPIFYITLLFVLALSGRSLGKRLRKS